MGEAVFTTARLTVRRWTEQEIDGLLAVYGDADAMRWVDDGLPITREECERWVQVTFDNYARRGYGMFALERRDGRALVGYGGIVHPGGQVDAEVKYALLRACWGQGLATEAAAGLVAYGARQHGLRRIIATTAPENLASHRVLMKAGFERGELRREEDGTDTQVFVWQPAPGAPIEA